MLVADRKPAARLGDMTSACEIIWSVDRETEAELARLAEAFEAAPKNLREGILRAAAKGAKPAEITRAIKHVYSSDYVERITLDVRDPAGAPERARKRAEKEAAARKRNLNEPRGIRRPRQPRGDA